MIKRQIIPYLKKSRLNYPILVVLGPKYSGKTELVMNEFSKSNASYVNLEDRIVLSKAKNDPAGFFKQYSFPIILDEAHRAPELLKYMPNLIDGYKGEAKIVLIGLSHPALKKFAKKEFVAVINLMPRSIAECQGKKLEEYICSGFMPNVCYSKYYSDYLEKNVEYFANISNKDYFHKFVILLAKQLGQTVKLKSLAKKIGVSSVTLSLWLNVLEDSCVIFKLPCYIDNFGKRTVKGPKVYFTDVALAAYLLGIENSRQVESHDMFESLFENMVIAEILKNSCNAGEEPKLYHLTDNHNFKIDLILHKKYVHLINITPKAHYNSAIASNLFRISEKIEKNKCLTVIYTGRHKTVAGINLRNFEDGLKFT
ncbi:MAG: DUF4143 domain-containing protein [Fibromonadales bacterium]|nr:DUF4143 domain-containing protein [Fibromonadales bacterium]